MVYTVVCYKETGFSRGNIPSTPAVLENAAKITLQANQIWKLQDRFLSQVKLSMSWDDAQDVDYMKVGDNYYTVENIQMSNGNVAIFTIALDPITSVGGVSGFTLIDGWAIRCHESSDGLFSNTLPEPWGPSEVLLANRYTMTSQGSQNIQLVASTIDLSFPRDVGTAVSALYATTFTDENTGLSVTVPKMPNVAASSLATTLEFVVTDPLPWTKFGERFVLPGVVLFDATKDNVKENIEIAIGVSALEGISAYYLVPNNYIDPEWGGNDSSVVENTRSGVTQIDGPAYKYGTYTPKNNKVYALYNTYTIVSVGSGNRASFPASELYYNDDAPRFAIFANVAPGGCPYLQPVFYGRRLTNPFENAVQGAIWINNTSLLGISEGFKNDLLMYDLTDQGRIWQEGAAEYHQTTGIVNSLVGTGAAMVGATNVGLMPGSNWIYQSDPNYSQMANAGLMGLEGVLGAIEGRVTTERNIAISRLTQQYNLATKFQNGSFNLFFPQDVNQSMFTGNNFMILQETLTDNDMEKLDNFLTMYGYSVSRRLEQTDFTSRTHFNFVQADNVAVEGPSMFMCNLISDYFAGGVRLWHELPNRAAMSDNPIKGGA